MRIKGWLCPPEFVFELKNGFVPQSTLGGQVSLVISLYLGAGTAQTSGTAPTGSSGVGGSAVVLGGVSKETLKSLTDDTQALQQIVTRPETL